VVVEYAAGGVFHGALFARQTGGACVVGRFEGLLVTDRHGAYNDYDADRHQYC